MTAIRRVVVVTLLAIWSFPATSLAAPEAAAPASQATRTTEPRGGGASGTETVSLGERERQAGDLQDFRGGGVSIYIGSGVLLVAVIILLILLI